MEAKSIVDGRISKWTSGLLTLFSAMVFGVSGCSDDPIVVIPDGWTFEVFADGILRVDNVVFDKRDILYATQEAPFVGKVVIVKDGATEPILTDLNRSDGLAIRGDSLYVVEEAVDGRVIQFNLANREQTVITRLNRPEGIDILPSGDLILVEDAADGRLVKVSLSGEIAVLADSFNRLEGVCLAQDGKIFFTETTTGRVLTFVDDSVSVLVEDLNNPDQIECDSDNVLWITEDACPGRLMRYENGEVNTFAEGLCSPQGIAFDEAGAVYVSEQGRNRIIQFIRVQP